MLYYVSKTNFTLYQTVHMKDSEGRAVEYTIWQKRRIRDRFVYSLRERGYHERAL